PEEMTRIEVRSEVVAERGELGERVDVVDQCSRVQLDAEHEVGVLTTGERRKIAPVRPSELLPLPLVLTLEVGEPAAGGEPGMLFAGAPCERKHAFDAERGRE